MPPHVYSKKESYDKNWWTTKFGWGYCIFTHTQYPYVQMKDCSLTWAQLFFHDSSSFFWSEHSEININIGWLISFGHKLESFESLKQDFSKGFRWTSSFLTLDLRCYQATRHLFHQLFNISLPLWFLSHRAMASSRDLGAYWTFCLSWVPTPLSASVFRRLCFATAVCHFFHVKANFRNWERWFDIGFAACHTVDGGEIRITSW